MSPNDPRGSGRPNQGPNPAPNPESDSPSNLRPNAQPNAQPKRPARGLPPTEASALRSALEAVPVSNLTAIRVRVPFRRPFATATGMWLHREAWLILLTGAGPYAGRTGLGEAVLEPDATEVEETILVRLIRETVAEATTGSLPDAEDLELLGTPGRAFRAAMDSARLDLAFDPDPTEVPVNGTIPFVAPDAAAEGARQAVEAGFDALKIKAGAERETEDLVARVRAIRRAVGPGVSLRIDVNGAWDLPTAEERLEAIARFGIEYVEQPLAPDDFEGAAELRRLVHVPIAADEAVSTLSMARRILDAGAADVLVVKPARVGGPVAVLEIAAAARARGVPVVISTLFETGIGIAAARACALLVARVDAAAGGERDAGDDDVMHAHGLATAGLLEHDLLAEPLPVDEGWMGLPGDEATMAALASGELGGLGIRLHARAVAEFTAEAL